jgi:hypothetical protein
MTRLGKIDITPAVDPSRCVPLLRDGELIAPAWHSPWARPIDTPGLSADGMPPQIKAAVRACADGERPWPLFLHGGVGTGKSYAAVMAWKFFGGWIGTLPDWAELSLSAKRETLTWTGGAKVWEPDLWDHWRRLQLVVVDELGTRKPSDAAYETLAQMLNVRANRPAIWISNHDSAGLLDVYDDRIVSRLEAGTVVKLSGPDRRIQRATVAP